MSTHEFEFRCVQCDAPAVSGSPWTSAGPCPACGSTEVVGKVTVRETIEVPEEAWSFVGRDATTSKRVLKGFARHEETRTGPMAGTRAWVEQMVDKLASPKRYKKRVTLADGAVVKDVDGPLSDQSLHGPQG